MPSRRRHASAAFAGPKKSWRMVCVGPAAGPGARTGSGTAGSTPHRNRRGCGPVRTLCSAAHGPPLVNKMGRVRVVGPVFYSPGSARSAVRPRSVFGVADAHYEHPRLAQIYDAFDGPRVDLDAYVGLVRNWAPSTFSMSAAGPAPSPVSWPSVIWTSSGSIRLLPHSTSPGPSRARSVSAGSWATPLPCPPCRPTWPP